MIMTLTKINKILFIKIGAWGSVVVKALR